MTRYIAVLLALTGVVYSGPAVGQHWTNESTRTKDSLRQLSFGVYGNYLRSDMSLADAFDETLSGVPDPEFEIERGLRRYSGCRRHSCTEKAVVVIDEFGDVQAAGLLHYNCSESRRNIRRRACSGDRMLTLLDVSVAGTKARSHVLDWAGQIEPNLAVVEIVAPVPHR